MLISESGERGPAADRAGAATAACRRSGAPRCAPSARVDAAGPRDGPSFAGRARRASSRCATCCPTGPRGSWSARCCCPRCSPRSTRSSAPAAGACRSRRWIAWLAVAAVPLPVAWLWLRLIGATGAIDVPDGPVLPDALPARDEAGSSRWSRPRSPPRSPAGARGSRPRALGAAERAPRRATAPRTARRGRGRRPGVEGLAVATVVWLCALAARHLGCSTRTPPGCSSRPRTCGCSPPPAAGACGPGSLALVAGLAPARRWRSCTSASRSGSARTSWRGAPRSARRRAPGCGRRCCSAALLAAFVGVVRVLLARRRIARETGPAAAPILTRGPVTYAGPGSLGGTESALRR